MNKKEYEEREREQEVDDMVAQYSASTHDGNRALLENFKTAWQELLGGGKPAEPEEAPREQRRTEQAKRSKRGGPLSRLPLFNRFGRSARDVEDFEEPEEREERREYAPAREEPRYEREEPQYEREETYEQERRDSYSASPPEYGGGAGGVELLPDEPQEILPPPEAVLTRDIVIEGSIVATESNVYNSGTIHGNVTSAMNFVSCGVVQGNVISSDVVFYEQSTVVGNVLSKGRTVATQDALVVGDVSAVEIVTDGKIRGNLMSNNAVCLRSNAVVMGNVTAKSLIVESGCVLRGYVDVAEAPLNELDAFDVSSRLNLTKQ